MRFRAWFMLVVVIASSDSSSAANTMEDILNAWRRRETYARSVRFDWKSQVTSLAKDQGEAVTHELTRTFVMDGLRIRHCSTGMRRVQDRFVQMPYTYVFDGKRSFFHYDKGQGTADSFDQSIGFVDDKGFAEKGNDHIEPLIIHYRILEPTLSAIERDSLSVSDASAVLRGASCVVVRQSQASGGLQWQLWLDPQHGYAVARYALQVNGKPVGECDIAYDKDADAPELWPTSWQATAYVGGQVYEGITAKVTSHAINPVVAQDEFTYEFPVNTKVNEHISGQEVVTYVVRPGGQRRMVTDGEQLAGATYQELVSTESGMAGQKSRVSWRVVSLLVLVAGFSTALVFAVRFRLRGGKT
jgi:hypothetical protein